MKNNYLKFLIIVAISIANISLTKAAFSPVFTLSGTSFCLGNEPLVLVLKFSNPIPDSVTVSYSVPLYSEYNGVQFFYKTNGDIAKDEEMVLIKTTGVKNIGITFTGTNSGLKYSHNEQITVLGLNPALTISYPNIYAENAFCKTQTITGIPAVNSVGGFYNVSKITSQKYFISSGYNHAHYKVNPQAYDENMGSIDINTIEPDLYEIAYFISSSVGCALTTVTVSTLPAAPVFNEMGIYCNRDGRGYSLWSDILVNYSFGDIFFYGKGYYSESNENIAIDNSRGYVFFNSSTVGGNFPIYFNAVNKGCPTVTGMTVITVTAIQPIPQLSLTTSVFCDTTKNFNIYTESSMSGGFFYMSNNVYVPKYINDLDLYINNGIALEFYKTSNWWGNYFVQYVTTSVGCGYVHSPPIFVTINGCEFSDDTDTLFMNKNGIIVSHSPIIKWTTVYNSSSYCIQLSTSPDFETSGNKLYLCGIDSNYYYLGPEIFQNARLQSGTKYYWRVATQDSDGNITGWSPTTWFVYGQVNKVENPSIVKVEIFPNPASDQITFVSSLSGSFSFKLYDLMGREITKASNLNINGSFTFSLSDFPKGIYTIRIQFKDETFTKKIVKE